MARPALEVNDLYLVVDPAALRERRLEATVERGVLRLSEEGLGLVIPAAAGVTVERITRGHGFVGGSVKGIAWSAEVWPRLGSNGRLRLEPVSVKAAFLPLPGFAANAVVGLMRERFTGKPGLHVGEGNVLEIDLAEILALFGVRLPAPQAVRAGEGVLEIEF